MHVFNATKDRHKHLREKQAAMSAIDMPFVDKTNRVINLSSGSLDNAEIALLKERLHYRIRRNSCAHPCHGDCHQGRITGHETTRH